MSLTPLSPFVSSPSLSFSVRRFALLAHPVGYNMTWAATVKEAQDSTVFDELPAIFKRFRVTFIACGLCIVMILVFRFIPDMEWGAFAIPSIHRCICDLDLSDLLPLLSVVSCPRARADDMPSLAAIIDWVSIVPIALVVGGHILYPFVLKYVPHPFPRRLRFRRCTALTSSPCPLPPPPTQPHHHVPPLLRRRSPRRRPRRCAPRAHGSRLAGGRRALLQQDCASRPERDLCVC